MRMSAEFSWLRRSCLSTVMSLWVLKGQFFDQQSAIVYSSVTEFSVKNFRDLLYSVVFIFFINLWFMVSYLK